MRVLGKISLFVSLVLIFLRLESPTYAQGFAEIDELNDVVQNLLGVVATIAGFLAFAALLFGGFRYIVAQGDPKQISAARSTISWALIGLSLIIVAWLVLLFFEQFTGIQVTRFFLRVDFTP
ncbi:hypothetical protein IH981_02915 [Patescibacteria group bacterium]|nr:hypothetical protein [Patescibacteria group bacterium]